MRLATCQRDGGTFVGAILDEQVVEVARDMLELIGGGVGALENARALARTATGGPLGATRLLAPIPRPRRDVFCVGWNYSEHFREGQLVRGKDVPADLPEWPALFSKGPNTVVGPDAGVLFPAPHSEQLDWECELAVVIGREGRDIPESKALEHVFGYTCANDVSVRDVQRRHGGQWFKGKNFDTHLPLGPWIVTADEIPNPHALRIATRVNGVTKQDSRTEHMVFTVARIIRDLSAGMTLVPGDVIITGTPEGVGFARKPPEFLKVGDVVEVEIEKIGILRNTVAARA
ncbi:MAG TPA: fumarylacetoacetate hydrolase family protein [Candidatus Limnocylindria bacterium]|nr:fumarylacetoacetate hydrolase family protein [Candidatus Limnocylindria bacterium]